MRREKTNDDVENASTTPDNQRNCVMRSVEKKLTGNFVESKSTADGDMPRHGDQNES